MLQQTRVQTVIPYYERWVSRFPDVHALALAHADDVLKMWEGLGYYSRARNLQRAAQMVRERHNGSLPGSYDQLHELPGIGTYTASAVSSIAFNAPHAAVDGNVKRLLSRILDLPAPSSSELQTAANQLLDRSRPGDFNQAMMELGATVCTPRNPACAECAVASLCVANRNHTVHVRPTAKKKAPLPEVRVDTLVAVNRGEILLVKRPASGLLGGLWSFPEISGAHRYQHSGTITHTYTHKRIQYQIYVTRSRVRVEANPRWHSLSELKLVPMSVAHRKIAAVALQQLGARRRKV